MADPLRPPDQVFPPGFPPDTHTKIANALASCCRREYLPSLGAYNLSPLVEHRPKKCLGCGSLPPVGWLQIPWLVIYDDPANTLGLTGSLCPNCVCRLCESTADAEEFLAVLQVACKLLY